MIHPIKYFASFSLIFSIQGATVFNEGKLIAQLWAD